MKLQTNENTPELETERLLLRKFTAQDLEDFHTIMADKVTNRFLPWFPTKTRLEAEALLNKNFLSHYEEASAYRYAICRKEDNRPIGYVNMSRDESYDFGYGLKPEFWHQGIVTEASLAVVRRIGAAGYPFLTATHDINNPHSGAVMHKLGMAYRYTYVEQVQPKDVTVTFRMYQLNLDGNSERTYRGYWERYPTHFVEKLPLCPQIEEELRQNKSTASACANAGNYIYSNRKHL